jgi:hypothetical protein
MIVRKICFLRSALNILALGALAACLSLIAFGQNSQDTPSPRLGEPDVIAPADCSSSPQRSSKSRQTNNQPPGVRSRRSQVRSKVGLSLKSKYKKCLCTRQSWTKQVAWSPHSIATSSPSTKTDSQRRLRLSVAKTPQSLSNRHRQFRIYAG